MLKLICAAFLIALCNAYEFNFRTNSALNAPLDNFLNHRVLSAVELDVFPVKKFTYNFVRTVLNHPYKGVLTSNGIQLDGNTLSGHTLSRTTDVLSDTSDAKFGAIRFNVSISALRLVTKRTDLRFLGNRISGKVQIELKGANVNLIAWRRIKNCRISLQSLDLNAIQGLKVSWTGFNDSSMKELLGEENLNLMASKLVGRVLIRWTKRVMKDQQDFLTESRNLADAFKEEEQIDHEDAGKEEDDVIDDPEE